MKSDKYINLAVCNVTVKCSYNIYEDAILSHEILLNTCYTAGSKRSLN